MHQSNDKHKKNGTNSLKNSAIIDILISPKKREHVNLLILTEILGVDNFLCFACSALLSNTLYYKTPCPILQKREGGVV